MTDPARDAAIEAAMQAAPSTTYREDVTPLVDAVLAVARPVYRAEALRDAAREAAGLWNVKPYVDDWLNNRADAEEDA